MVQPPADRGQRTALEIVALLQDLSGRAASEDDIADELEHVMPDEELPPLLTMLDELADAGLVVRVERRWATTPAGREATARGAA